VFHLQFQDFDVKNLSGFWGFSRDSLKRGTPSLSTCQNAITIRIWWFWQLGGPKRVAIVGGWLVVVFQLLFVPPAALLARLSLCTCCRGAKVFGAGQSAVVTSATMLQESREK